MVPEYTAAELEDLIPNELVPVNLRPVYHDLGVVEAKAGAHVLVLDKLDDNPMLVEGVLLIPENEYRHLSIPNEVAIIEDLQELGCSELVAVRSGLADGVDSVANDVNPDLTQDELLELIGVDDLITPNPSGDGRSALHLIATVLIVLVCGAVIRWRATVELPEDVDRSG